MLLHTQPDKETKEAVLFHPVMGASGERICIEDLQPARKLVVYPGDEPFS